MMKSMHTLGRSAEKVSFRHERTSKDSPRVESTSLPGSEFMSPARKTGLREPEYSRERTLQTVRAWTTVEGSSAKSRWVEARTKRGVSTTTQALGSEPFPFGNGIVNDRMILPGTAIPTP